MGHSIPSPEKRRQNRMHRVCSDHVHRRHLSKADPITASWCHQDRRGRWRKETIGETKREGGKMANTVEEVKAQQRKEKKAVEPYSLLPSLTDRRKLLCLPSMQSRGDITLTLTLPLRCCLGARGCKQDRLVNSWGKFPRVSPGVARFLGPFLSLQPSGRPLPADPNQAPAAPLSPPFPQLSRGARVSLMRSGLCLSHPSRVAGWGKHEKEPIWLLTSPPALLSLSSPLLFQPPTPPLPFPFCGRQNQTDKPKTQALIKLRSGTTFPSH